MIGYTTVGANDYGKALEFYDALFGVIGGKRVMIALNVGSKEKVHAVYDMARKLGGADEGPAGPRSDNFYAGYFRDLDGNKLCAFTMGSK
mgnify:CR=1 FL=1